MATNKRNATTPKLAVKNKPAAGVKKTKLATHKRPSPRAEPSAPPTEAAEIPHDAIAARAYFIYVNAGSPEGMELHHWLEAEAQLRVH